MRRLPPLLLVAGLLWLTLAGVSRADPEQVIRTIKALGGKVERDDQAPGHPVITIDLTNTEATDAHLKEVASIPTVQSLSLLGTRVTDEGLKGLSRLKQLKSLDVSRTKVTAAGGGRAMGFLLDLTLEDGRLVVLDELHIGRTYAGWGVGQPTDEDNAEQLLIVADLLLRWRLLVVRSREGSGTTWVVPHNSLVSRNALAAENAAKMRTVAWEELAYDFLW